MNRNKYVDYVDTAWNLYICIYKCIALNTQTNYNTEHIYTFNFIYFPLSFPLYHRETYITLSVCSSRSTSALCASLFSIIWAVSVQIWFPTVHRLAIMRRKVSCQLMHTHFHTKNDFHQIHPIRSKRQLASGYTRRRAVTVSLSLVSVSISLCLCVSLSLSLSLSLPPSLSVSLSLCVGPQLLGLVASAWWLLTKCRYR